jgi:hypothetical protein
MDLQELRSNTIGDFIDEVGEPLTQEDYNVIRELDIRTRASLLGVEEKLAVAALLMSLINTVSDKAIAFSEPCDQ